MRLSEQLLTTNAIVRPTSSVRSGFEFVGVNAGGAVADHELYGQF